MDFTFDFNLVWRIKDYLLAGIVFTSQVTLYSLIPALAIGLVVAILTLSKKWFVSVPAQFYVEFFRNTPALVLLLWVYYALPLFLPVDFTALTSCVIALGMNSAAYMAEVFRAGIQSVDKGQIEAARSLGMSHFQTMRKIVLPHAVRTMMPPFVNQTISLVKWSSLVSVVGLADLTYRAQLLSTKFFRPIEIFTFVAVIYFLLCGTLAYFSRYLEKRLAIK